MKPDAPAPPKPPFVIRLAVSEHDESWVAPIATAPTIVAGFAWHGPSEDEVPDTERMSEPEPAPPASSKPRYEGNSRPRKRLELVFE